MLNLSALRVAVITLSAQNRRGHICAPYQGGSLSCALYTLYTNDLSLHVPECVTTVQFADDTQLLITGKKQDMQNMIVTMESALDSLYQWYSVLYPWHEGERV